jgi:hypothetical protein
LGSPFSSFVDCIDSACAERASNWPVHADQGTLEKRRITAEPAELAALEKDTPRLIGSTDSN